MNFTVFSKGVRKMEGKTENHIYSTYYIEKHFLSPPYNIMEILYIYVKSHNKNYNI